MEEEVLELNRCCFCLPPRCGLIAWGYFKLVLSLSLLAYMTASLVRLGISSTIYQFDIMSISIFLFFLILDVFFSFILLVGGHMNAAKLFLYYYIYCVVMICIFALFYTWSSGYKLYFAGKYVIVFPKEYWLLITVFLEILLIGFSSFGIQIHIILLTKSEFSKLWNNSKCEITLENAISKLVTVDQEQGTGHKINNMLGGINNYYIDAEKDTFVHKKLNF